jgi:Clr5 domain
METSLAHGHTVLAATTCEDSRTSHTADEWEHWRPLITQLYVTEDKTLKMVQKTLGDQHHFHAT